MIFKWPYLYYQVKWNKFQWKTNYKQNICHILYWHLSERIIDMHGNSYFVDNYDCIEKTTYQFHSCYFHCSYYGAELNYMKVQEWKPALQFIEINWQSCFDPVRTWECKVRIEESIITEKNLLLALFLLLLVWR